MVASATAIFVLFAVAASDPALAKHKGKGKSGGASSSKRVSIMAPGSKEPADGPVRAQLTKTLKKQKIKIGPKSKEAPSDDQAWMALGRKLKVDGFVVPSYASVEKGKHSVELTIRTASDGSVAGHETFEAKGAPKKLAAAVGKGFWKKLGSAVEGVSAPAVGQEGTGMPARDLSHETASATETSKPATETSSSPATETASATETPPAPPTPSPAASEDHASATPASAPEPKPAETARATASEPEKADGVGPVAPALTLRLAVRYVSRSFEYSASSPLPVSTVATPTIGGAAAWFPITYAGLEVETEFASWLKYTDRFPTVTSDLIGSAVFRLPLSFGTVTARAGGFRHMFAMSDDGTNGRVDQILPDLVYVGFRAGAGFTYRLIDALTLTAEANYRVITNMNAGAYAVTSLQYFPGAVPGPGMDGSLTVAYRLTPMFELQAGFDVRRYVLSVRGSSSTRINAAYLTDQSLAGWIGVGAVFGGV